jgi:predicted Fe-Mo cluster-binding NifX family protein
MKVLLTINENNIAPRFDLTTEVTIADIDGGLLIAEPRCVLLPGPSGDELCSLILKENIEIVICGGIEEVHYQYLAWKKIKVIDRVIGPSEEVLKLALGGELRPGTIVYAGRALNEDNQ